MEHLPSQGPCRWRGIAFEYLRVMGLAVVRSLQSCDLTNLKHQRGTCKGSNSSRGMIQTQPVGSIFRIESAESCERLFRLVRVAVSIVWQGHGSKVLAFGKCSSQNAIGPGDTSMPLKGSTGRQIFWTIVPGIWCFRQFKVVSVRLSAMQGSAEQFSRQCTCHATSGPPPPLPPLPPELAQKEPLPDCQGDAANHSHVPICQEPSPESQTAASRQASMGGSCSCRVRLQVPTQDEDDFTAEESGNKHPLTRCLCSLCCRITLSCCEERRLEQQSEEARASFFSSCDSP